MKSFINSADTALDQSLSGFGRAHGDLVSVHFAPRFVTRRQKKSGKVALVSGGGSGHAPLHAGYVGTGMLDAACPGEIFTSPTPDQILAAAEAADGGAGILFIVTNHPGDVKNFERAAEMIGGPSATVLTTDDVAGETDPHSQGRRGFAGTVVVEKIVGAAAEEGRALADLKALGERVNAASATIGVALTSGTVPAAGRAMFDLGDDEMAFGVGIQGEPGRRGTLKSADDIVAGMMDAIAASLPAANRVLAVVNGLGGTPLMQLYLVMDAVARQCDDRDITIARTLVGNYCTSLDMKGASVTLTALDDEMTALWDAPVHTPALRWG
ncbi:dihydroxyacetone kinase subunit DhaK [Acuticoccus sp. MNP-M23]|uniref:dihydroxyacetone kinase subunit DhaK n=1 Tax=Acuticoccus sp. MNP-M23 TaxID=3072793 RepID=UPI0028164EDB|nr:dihydroxyacetone kinase subunit DhaK [Acuticoccus sp. MNP-M23]WMS43853.1 dihydroxyacetone kinase subunit DhaK [Acuticoccus sp. MNP-M23]